MSATCLPPMPLSSSGGTTAWLSTRFDIMLERIHMDKVQRMLKWPAKHFMNGRQLYSTHLIPPLPPTPTPLISMCSCFIRVVGVSGKPKRMCSIQRGRVCVCVCVYGGLPWWLSRRITAPLHHLSSRLWPWDYVCISPEKKKTIWFVTPCDTAVTLSE